MSEQSVPSSDELRKSDPDVVWILMPKDSVPERWTARAVDLALVPLAPDEAQNVLTRGSTSPSLDRHDEGIARLVARGLSAEEIARHAHMTPRSVYRRMARLRHQFGARTTSELVARLAREGF